MTDTNQIFFGITFTEPFNALDNMGSNQKVTPCFKPYGDLLTLNPPPPWETEMPLKELKWYGKV